MSSVLTTTPPSESCVDGMTALIRMSLERKLMNLGLGLSALGRPDYINVGHGGDFESTTIDALRWRTHEVLDAAWDAGITYVDTARSYGMAEQFLGEWLQAHPDRRQHLMIGSKWGHAYAAGWQVDAEVHEVTDHSLDMFERQWEETRRALGTTPDVYFIHSVTAESPAFGDRALLERLRDLSDEGVTVGFTTSGPRQGEVLDRALALAPHVSPFRAVEATWNLLETSAASALERAHRTGWLVVAKEVLANGRILSPVSHPELHATAEALGMTPDAVALRAAIDQSFVDIALSGATTLPQLASNLAAADVNPGSVSPRPQIPEEYWTARSRLAWS